MKHAKVIAALLLLFGLSLKTIAEPRRISVEHAKLLARAAAESEGLTRLKGFALEEARLEQFPDFYFFDALVSEPATEGFSGHYAVDKLTGDVWDPYKCTRFSGPHLLKLQRQFKQQLGSNAREDRQLAKDKPCLIR